MTVCFFDYEEIFCLFVLTLCDIEHVEKIVCVSLNYPGIGISEIFASNDLRMHPPLLIKEFR